MALTITTALEGARTQMWTHEGDDILYVNKDRTKVVPEDSPEAAYVLVGPGGQIEDDEADRLGLKKAKAGKPDDEAKAMNAPSEDEKSKPEAKAVEQAPANKARQMDAGGSEKK